MVSIEDYGTYETAWCPGCGNHSILQAMKKALVALDLQPSQLLLVSGIGQAAKAPHYLNANVFNGLHGRSLPVATGAKTVNRDLTVIVESGDGCTYGEGGNHLLAAIRRNIDVTVIVHNNQVYGLTKGQASPTSSEGFVTKAYPHGVFSSPFKAPLLAVAMRAGFVARGFSGRIDHLAQLVQEGVRHRGFSLVEVLQPCVSFNRVNTFSWYNQRCYELPLTHDPKDWENSIAIADQWGDRIPIGIIYRNDRPAFDENLVQLGEAPLVSQEVRMDQLKKIMISYY